MINARKRLPRATTAIVLALLLLVFQKQDTLLVYSARLNALLFVRLLLMLGANPNGTKQEGPAIVSHENTQGVFYTLVEHGANIPDKVVQDFVYRGNMPELLYCLDHGYRLTKQKMIGLLSCACRYHDGPYNFEMVRFFVEKGADVNGKPNFTQYNSDQQYPNVLCSAVASNNWEAFQYLLSKGAKLDIDTMEPSGKTLLSYAQQPSPIYDYLLIRSRQTSLR